MKTVVWDFIAGQSSAGIDASSLAVLGWMAQGDIALVLNIFQTEFTLKNTGGIKLKVQSAGREERKKSDGQWRPAPCLL